MSRVVPFVDLAAQYQALRPELDQALQRVCARGSHILGPEVEAFERAFATYCQRAFAVAVASGTDALELSLRASGIGPGDEVIVPAFTFFATAAVVAAVGGTPVFADIDAQSYTLDVDSVAAALTSRTRAIIPVHLYGQPADMEQLTDLAQQAGVTVIEDCAQACGASIQDRRVGSWGNAGAFSFYPTKNLGAFGDAGMVVTDDARLADQVRLLRAHGSLDRVQHIVISRNSRMDELQAALLGVKLRHLDRWNDQRHRLAMGYRHGLEGVLPPEALPQQRPGSRHVYHLFVVRFPRRDELRQRLLEQGIATQVHYPIPLHLEPAFASLGYRPGQFVQAERAAAEVLSLPLFSELSLPDLHYVVNTVKGLVSGEIGAFAKTPFGEHQRHLREAW